MNPKDEIFLGLMSGTSLDGVDVAIVDFGGFPPRLLHGSTTPYPDDLRSRLRQVCRTQQASLDTLFTLDAKLGEFYAACALRAIENCGLAPGQVTALGCHGQTLRHSPGSETPHTVQIGDPNRVAALTGIDTVADLRRKDIALGGQAAPLAPALHRYLFRSDAEDRVVINIGGIANLTCLPADSDAPLTGFDTGPGNTLLDYWAEEHRGTSFDAGGAWARKGEIDHDLLETMLSTEPYFEARAPKSTGTEYFSPAWLQRFLHDGAKPENVQSTLVELTVITIANAIDSLANSPRNCFVCGGGAFNGYLLERLQLRLPNCEVQTTAAIGLDPEYVEAVAFAWLARERLHMRPGNIPSITLARPPTLLGAIYASDRSLTESVT